MADELKKLSKYLLMAGVAATIAAPFLTGVVGDLTWAIAVIGLIAGISVKPSVSFFLAALALAGISVGAAVSIPAVGSVLVAILKNMGLLFGTVLIVPAIKIAFKQFGIKY